MTADDLVRIAQLMNDLDANHRAIGRVESIYSRAIFEIEWLQGYIQRLAKKLQCRRCHDCGHVGWYTDGTLPASQCERCGSADTRIVRAVKLANSLLGRP